MNERAELPRSGYRLLRVVAIEQMHSIADPESDLPATDREISFSWDWRIGDVDNGEIEVFLRIQVGGSAEAPETVSVGLVGEFVARGITSIGLEKFVQISAPAMLLPYIREHVSALTSRGPFGAFYLPSLNVIRLMERYEFGKSSGAAQIAEDPTLPERLFGDLDTSDE